METRSNTKQWAEYPVQRLEPLTNPAVVQNHPEYVRTITHSLSDSDFQGIQYRLNKGGAKLNFLTRNKKWLLLFVALIALLSVSAFAGQGLGKSSATIELDGQMVTLNELNDEISDRENTLLNIDNQIDTREEELESMEIEIEDLVEEKIERIREVRDVKNDLNEAKEVIEQQESLEAVISDLEDTINSHEGRIEELDLEYEGRIEELDLEIEEKKDELASIESGIVTKKAEPVQLPAGYFTVGADIQSGRYKIEPNGGNGNFFVNDGRKANIILGTGDSFYLSEYIMNLSDGDVIESTLPVRYTPVE